MKNSISVDYRNNLELPRGIRNNNPGNLRGGSPWLGLAGLDDKGFCIFEDVAYGVRAWLINYYTQVVLRKTTTVRQFVEKYAPATENNVDAYIAALGGDGPLPTSGASVREFAMKCFRHENGQTEGVDQGDYNTAISRLNPAQKAFFFIADNQLYALAGICLLLLVLFLKPSKK